LAVTCDAAQIKPEGYHATWTPVTLQASSWAYNLATAQRPTGLCYKYENATSTDGSDTIICIVVKGLNANDSFFVECHHIWEFIPNPLVAFLFDRESFVGSEGDIANAKEEFGYRGVDPDGGAINDMNASSEGWSHYVNKIESFVNRTAGTIGTGMRVGGQLYSLAQRLNSAAGGFGASSSMSLASQKLICCVRDNFPDLREQVTNIERAHVRHDREHDGEDFRFVLRQLSRLLEPREESNWDTISREGVPCRTPTDYKRR
jgi:hypothetical protein